MNRFIKIFSKRIPLGMCVSAAFIAAAITYSVSYHLAMHRFNEVVSYNYEKQQMYSKLSEVDHAIRQEYVGDIDENYLMNNICSGYAQGIKGNDCKYYSGSEYKEYAVQQSQKLESVNADRIDDVGYLKIFNIGADSANSFIRAAEEMETDDIHKFIVDLRGVSGGDSSQLAKIINFLFPAGDIVSTVSKNGARQVEFKSTSSGFDGNIVMLCDENTSGFAEVLLSAVKDFERARVVGEKTAGKAIKMSTVQLSDGSAIIFPSAHYVTKGGTSLYKSGVSPDVEVMLDEQAAELLKNNQLDFSDDAQILAAMDLLN